MRGRWLMVMTIAAVATAAARAQQAPDPEDTLRRTQERLLADLARLPRYTCVQTITRHYYRPRSEGHSCKALISEHDKRTGGLHSIGWDRLRLEVAIADGQNVYSWVGAARFEEDNFGELAGHGPLGSGDFGSFLDSVLRHATISYQTQKVVNGRPLLEYSYDMPGNKSGYLVLTNAGWVPTPYNGTLLLDPSAADVVGLTVRTAELPESNPACQANSEVKYQRTAIHDSMVLIPRETRLNTIDRAGSESLSLTTYEKCREYASKSRMLLRAPAGTGAAGPAPTPTPTPLSPNLRFECRIVTPIDSDAAAAGDPIEGVLRFAIHDKNNNRVFPAGAHLQGRLTRLEHRSESYESVRVGVQWESIEFNGRTASLRAAPEPFPVNKTASVFSDGESPSDRIFVFRKPRLHLEQFDWNWTTLGPAGGEKHVFPGLTAMRTSTTFPRTIGITDGEFPIAASSWAQFKFAVPAGATGVHLEGTFSVSGGGSNDVAVSLFSSEEFANLQNASPQNVNPPPANPPDVNPPDVNPPDVSLQTINPQSVNSPVVNPQNQEPARAIYASGRTREGTLNVPLPSAAGTYYLVFSNKFPLSTPKVVQASLRLHYNL
ncbi:MAG TPA: hypothetical protein VI488_06125 [Candidatus Angelobacter sp.]